VSELESVLTLQRTDQFGNFMSPGPAKSVHGPIVTNANELCAMYPAAGGGAGN